MIIQCKNCSRKFLVKDSDIPDEGKMVECGYCSQKWFQAPIKDDVLTLNNIQSSSESNIEENVSDIKNEEIEVTNISNMMEFEASDGRTYRFLGSQWAELLRSGKTGVLAKRKITTELNKLAGITKPKKSRKRMIDPSSEQISGETVKKEGLGFFGYIFLLIIITFSIVGILKTFEKELIMYIPESQYIFDRGEFIFESIDNMIVILRDLIKSY